MQSFIIQQNSKCRPLLLVGNVDRQCNYAIQHILKPQLMH